MNFTKDTSSSSGVSEKQRDMQERAFDPSKPAQTRSGKRVTYDRVEDDGRYRWEGFIEGVESRISWWPSGHFVGGQEHSYDLVNVDPAAPASQPESDAEFLERCEREHDEYVELKPAVDNPEYRRLIALAKEALRLKAVVGFRERQDRLARRASTPPSAGDVTNKMAEAFGEAHYQDDWQTFKFGIGDVTVIERIRKGLRAALSALPAQGSEREVERLNAQLRQAGEMLHREVNKQMKEFGRLRKKFEADAKRRGMMRAAEIVLQADEHYDWIAKRIRTAAAALSAMPSLVETERRATPPSAGDVERQWRPESETSACGQLAWLTNQGDTFRALIDYVTELEQRCERLSALPAPSGSEAYRAGHRDGMLRAAEIAETTQTKYGGLKWADGVSIGLTIRAEAPSAPPSEHANTTDAERYHKLRSIGAAPNGTKSLEEGLVLVATNLDDWIDKHWPKGPTLVAWAQQAVPPAPEANR